jgi:hypothetical protein
MMHFENFPFKEESYVMALLPWNSIKVSRFQDIKHLGLKTFANFCVHGQATDAHASSK